MSTDKLEEITCYFCGTEKAVFSNGKDEEEWDCRSCNASYFQKVKPGQTDKRAVVIQDYATMYDDSSMGFHIVFPILGDIERKIAQNLRAARTLDPMPGFNALSQDFMGLLWSNSNGSPRLDFETIEEVCRKHANSFTPSSDRDKLTQLLFDKDVTNGISARALNLVHQVINSIPKNNDNLIRYFVAEGQEELILKGIRRAYKKHRDKGNEFGVKIATSMCT